MLDNGSPTGSSMFFGPIAWATALKVGPQNMEEPLVLPYVVSPASYSCLALAPTRSITRRSLFLIGKILPKCKIKNQKIKNEVILGFSSPDVRRKKSENHHISIYGFLGVARFIEG